MSYKRFERNTQAFKTKLRKKKRMEYRQMMKARKKLIYLYSIKS